MVIEVGGHVFGCMKQLVPGGGIDHLRHRQCGKVRPEVTTLEQTTWRSWGTWKGSFGAMMEAKD